MLDLSTKPAQDYPKTGEFRGETIDLEHAVATLSGDELAEVVVDVPGQGLIRPWRFAQRSSDVQTGPDGSLIIG